MAQKITINVNNIEHQLEVDPDTPLLYVLRNDLGLLGTRFGCGSEQCNACKVLVDGADVPSCKLPVSHVEGLKVITVEGLGTADDPHPLQEAFIEEQAIQCGYCASGLIIAAQGLLNRTRYPTDEEIRTALSDNICRCGIYERVRRAVKMRIGRPEWEPIYQVIEGSETEFAITPESSSSELPISIKQTPELDAWIRINTDGTITIFTGKVEIGQGIRTAVTQIAAEELDVSLARIRVTMADTGLTPDEGITAGSMSLQMTGNAIRFACAEARYILLSMAFEELESETPQENLEINDGTIVDPATGRQTTYWDLLGGQLFGRSIVGLSRPKPASAYQTVGKASKRVDLLRKVTGKAGFVHDLSLPGMVHGRIVRPPGYSARLVSIDDIFLEHIPGIIKLVRDGSFLAVIAEREEQAIEAREYLLENSVWENKTQLPPVNELFDHLLKQPDEPHLIVDGTAVSDPVPSLEETTPGATQKLKATYYRPYHMHGSLGPSAAVALLQDGKMTIWSHTQGVFLLQKAIAQVLLMPVEDVRVIHTEGSGSYGHNGADDVALDAALLARALPGRPVSVKWMRSDEHLWEPYGAAMAIKMQASLNRKGEIVSWNHDVWSYPHTARPRASGSISGLLPSWYLDEPFVRPQPKFIIGTHFGGYRNADPLYSVPNRRIVSHFVPNSPLRTSSLRSLGAYGNIFAIESFIDELATAAGIDPIEFRLGYLADERAKEVVKTAVEKSGWRPRTGPSGLGSGQGFAFAQYKNRQCYAAVVVELSVDLDDGQIKLQRAVIAADAGQIVNPDGLSNQLEGGFFQSASWTLMEQVDFDTQGIKSEDWDSYPILRFSGSPRIETFLINRPDAPFLGSGEASQGPTAAAIANAIFDATGLRMRELPLTAEKVQKALLESNRP